MNKTKLTLVAASLLLSPLAPAQDLAFNSFDSFMNEDVLLWGEEDKLFGATKYIKHLNEAPATATVITYEQMVRMGATTLQEVLKHVPGLSIVKTSHYGKRNVVVRGVKNSEGDLVLFNIDNHNVAHYIAGNAAWMFLPMQIENIKRIEVIRGPGSALYGANAAAAVINIITKTHNDIEGTSFSLRAGSHNERTLSGLSSSARLARINVTELS
jgi:iron complex outermembrane receptor protein